jgi:NAD-dependent deacetylase
MKFYGLKAIKASDLPACECGGIIKPDVVLFQEPLKADVMLQAKKYIMRADLLIVGGTSLSVYPAANLVHYYPGNKLVLINNSETNLDNHFDLIIKDSLGKVFSEIWKKQEE